MPRLTLVTRKAFGGAYIVMDSGRSADLGGRRQGRGPALASGDRRGDHGNIPL